MFFILLCFPVYKTLHPWEVFAAILRRRHARHRCLRISPLCRADMKPTTLPPLQLNPPSGESLNLESGCALIKDPRRGPRRENKPRPSLSPSFCRTIMIRAACSPPDLHGSGARCERALQCWRRGFVTVSRVLGIVCLSVLKSKMAFFLENGICVILASLADGCSSPAAISSRKWSNGTFRWTTMTGQFYIFSRGAFFSVSLSMCECFGWCCRRLEI